MADHYELLSLGRTRRMTTNAETYSTGNSEEPNLGLCRLTMQLRATSLSTPFLSARIDN
jgi:hypothetical protein